MEKSLKGAGVMVLSSYFPMLNCYNKFSILGDSFADPWADTVFKFVFPIQNLNNYRIEISKNCNFGGKYNL
jgi:hypothetical protein